MKLYSIGLLPVTLKLKDCSAFVKTAIANNEFVSSKNSGENMNLQGPPHWTQSLYADDSACLGQFALLRQLLQLLVDEGPNFGYFSEPDISYLVVHPDFVDEVKYYIILKISKSIL